LNTAREALAGFQTASNTSALAAGGFSTGNSAATESYNGSAWTTVNSLNTAGYGRIGFGIQTAGIVAGGTTPTPGFSTATESWNGTSWTSNPTGLNTGRDYAAAAGVQTLGLIFGGRTTGPVIQQQQNYGMELVGHQIQIVLQLLDVN
jgi:hypothetical protein